MKTVTFAELKDKLEQLYDSAHVERVHITEDGEDKVVMMPYIVYKQMRSYMPRRAYHVSELPEDILKEIREMDYSDEEEPDTDSSS